MNSDGKESSEVEIMRTIGTLSAHNKRLQLDSARAVRLHEYSCLVFYHANSHHVHCD